MIHVDEGYLALVRSQPCAFCGAPPPSDPEHLRPRCWRESARNDYMALPLCRACHTLRHSVGLSEALARRSVKLTAIIETMTGLLVRHFERGPEMEVGL